MKQQRLFSLFLVMAVLAAAFTGCGQKTPDFNLSDLGGVCGSSYEEIDFSNEISGILSEDTRERQVNTDDISTVDNIQDGQYSNRLFCWGIARKPDNRTPDADPGAPELLKKYGGIYLGDITKKVIYLTFDEGYENGYTTKILDSLRDNNAKAVFFITGPYLKEHQDLVRRMLEEGHTVGNHTIHHPSLPSVSDDVVEEEVLGLDRTFQEKFGQHMKFLRPPKGEYSERTLALTQKLGYTNTFWSFAYDDWYRDRQRGADYAYNMVMRNLHNGAILLLHAVSRDNAEAMDRIIKGIREKGYEIGDLNDLTE